MKESRFYKVMRPIIKALVFIFLTPKCEGLENIPKTGKLILAGNHTSILDPFLIMSMTKRPIHYLAKKELFKGPKKIIFNNLGLIPVNRSIKDKTVLKNAKKYLDSDMVIGIFPEGTTEKGKGLLPFKIGTVKLAHDTNSQIVPFSITGKYKLFSRSLKIKFGKPINIKSNNLEKENENLRNTIKQMIKEN